MNLESIQPNKKTGDIEPLFDKNSPNSLRNKLEGKGFYIISEYTENGERVTNLHIPEGEILFIFGFQQIDINEKRWFNMGSDNKLKYQKPFKFDVESEEFIKLKGLFISKLNGDENLDTIVVKLEDLIKTAVVSDIGYEEAMSLSDIIRRRKGACASKSILSGSILTESIRSLKIGLINGHLTKIQDRVSMPFSHAWLRISNGSECVLYDPMYHKREHYTFDSPINKDSIFNNYTVSAYPFATLQRIGMKKLLSGVKITKSYDGKKNELKIEPELSLDCQFGGQMSGKVYIEKGGILKLVNGNIETETLQNGPRLLYPLLDIQKQ